jgi:hypothetical protein
MTSPLVRRLTSALAGAMQTQREAGMVRAASTPDVPDDNVGPVGKYADRMAELGRR